MKFVSYRALALTRARGMRALLRTIPKGKSEFH